MLKKTRVISLLLCLAMLVSLLPATVLAAGTSGSCGSGVQWSYSSSTKTLTISGSGKMDDYYIESNDIRPWSEYSGSIEKIVISSGVTYIGMDAFGGYYGDSRDYTSLKTVSIADTVTEIGNSAFEGAPITQITLPSRLKTVGTFAFRSADITDVVIPASVTSIGKRAFDANMTVQSGNPVYLARDGVLFRKVTGGLSLVSYPQKKTDTDYTIPSDVVSMDEVENAYNTNDSLVSLTIPGSIRTIPSGVLYGCDNLKQIHIEDGVETLAPNAFVYCAPDACYIPASVKNFQVTGFYEEDTAGSSFYFYGDAPAFTVSGYSESWSVWMALGDTTIHYPAGASGWDSVIAAYNQYPYKDSYPVVFQTWNPAGGSSRPVPLTLESFSSENEVLTFAFSSAISRNPDWTKGSIYIRNYSSDAVALTIDDQEFYALGGRVGSGRLIIPNVMSVLPAGTYYVSFDPGVICAAAKDPNGNIPVYDGSADKEALKFQNSSGFTVGRDSNSFIHYGKAGGGFEGVRTYAIDSAYFNRLTKNSGIAETNMLKKEMNSEWNGSCYGIAATMALCYNKKVDVTSLSGSGTLNFYDLPLPCRNPALLNTINFYQLSQFLSAGGKEDASVGSTSLQMMFSTRLPTFLEGFVSYLQKHPVTVFTYDYKSDGRQHGHAIVTDGCSYDSTTDSYTVKLYDENSYGGGNSLPALIDMTISGDCTAFSFTDANENPISNSSYISMNYLDLDRIASSGRTSGEKSSGDMILIPAHGSCTLTGSSGKTLICRDGVLSGTMSVLDARDIVRSQTDADASQILVRVPSETSYTVKSGTAELDVTISSDTGLTSVTGTGLSAASVTPGKELTMQGNSYEFRAVQTTPDLISTNENEMIGLSGTASSSVTLTSSAARAKTLEIRTSGTISGASAESYEGSKTQAIPTAPALRSGSTLTAGGSASAGTAFADVPADAYYKDAVDWAVANGVTVGTGANTFSPNSVCTRAQSVTFLWRASGSPAPGSSAMPFSDVPAGSYYYKAVQWAVERGIVKGTSAKTFSPNASCSRAQIVTMLWRFGGSETADAAARFADVPASAYFAGAVQWAVANQITNGAGANTFRPSGSCTRAQIVTFLYRYQNK